MHTVANYCLVDSFHTLVAINSSQDPKIENVWSNNLISKLQLILVEDCLLFFLLLLVLDRFLYFVSASVGLAFRSSSDTFCCSLLSTSDPEACNSKKKFFTLKPLSLKLVQVAAWDFAKGGMLRLKNPEDWGVTTHRILHVFVCKTIHIL